MIRVVLDSNVLVSALLSPGRTADQIIQRWRNSDFLLCTTSAQIEEVSHVLMRPKLSKKASVRGSEIETLIDELNRCRVDISKLAILEERIVYSDPDDDAILAAALAGNADVIVSGDHHLLDLRRFRGIPIVTPREFLEMLPQD